MKSKSYYLSAPAAIVVVVAALSLTSAGQAIAQGALKPVLALIVNDASRPVPTASVDEPGRVPFSHDQVGECGAATCSMQFPAVPEGKRLVILHVSVVARPSSTSTIVDFADLTTSNPADPSMGVRNLFKMTLIGEAGAIVLGNTWGTNQPVLAYVEAGYSPSVSVSTRDGGNIFFSQATLSGYFVNVE